MISQAFQSLIEKDKSIDLILDPSNYVISNIHPLQLFDYKNGKYLYDKSIMYTSYIFSYNVDKEEVLKELKESGSVIITYGFYGITRKRQLQTGYMLYQALKRFSFKVCWNKEAVKHNRLHVLITSLHG